MKRVKNNTQTADSWAGQQIEPGEYYTIQDTELLRWQNDAKVLESILDSSLVFNDGDSDYSDPVEALNLLKDILPKDSDGRILQRPVAGRAGWKAQFHAMRITTSTENGVYSKDKNGNDLGFCTYTMYNEANQVTTNIAECVKTVVNWEPTHDMEIIGGRVFQRQAPNTDIWMYVTAAAHIPANYGGSVAFLQGGMNLYDIADGGEADFDGRAAKYITYDSQNHSGRFEILFKHNAGIQHSISLVFEMFKP